MSLEDVSNDLSMVNWIRQCGHGHLLDEQIRPSRIASSIPPPIPPRNYNDIDPYCDSYHRSRSFSRYENFHTQSYNPPYRCNSFISSPAEFLAPRANRSHVDMDIDTMRCEPNTRVIRQAAQDDVVYKQRVFVRYLQPPTPPVGGPIIVREKQPPPPPPESPLVIKRAPPPPPTPPPVTIREHPPPLPPPEGTTIIDKMIPAAPKPQRQVIVEQYPQLPPKPQNVIIERWLPMPPRKRPIFYQRLPAPTVNQPTRPMIIQYSQPQVRIQREIRTEPCVQYPCPPVPCPCPPVPCPCPPVPCPCPPVPCPTDINQILSQIGTNQHMCSTLPPSSLTSYNPCSTLQQCCCCISQPQSNMVIMQKEQQPCTIPSSCYAMPLTCVCSAKSTPGLGGYGCGITTMPTVGQCGRQTTVYNVPENIPIDNVMRQFGIDPSCIQRPTNMIPYETQSSRNRILDQNLPSSSERFGGSSSLFIENR
ncbi:unnamed protein product [Rotaria sordida]|uniref:Uncharacterized protein n=1 Tax=Rotaria sordida TaxID=392033 RepID=A0A815PRV7_9BILA|nr:unnamed protein product [Rotaria sordida]